MIKTQDLKLQMDELTKQNDMVLIELEQVKKMLLGSSGSQGSQGSQGGQGSQDSQGGSGQKGGQQQASGQDQQSQAGGGGQGQQSQQSAQSGKSSGGSGGGQVSDLAYELLKIKDMVDKLEQKTAKYVSDQSSGSMTEKDAVNLVLTLMNGMVDWASEFVLSKSSGSDQLQ
ncbi:hypothetical protein [Paenibacillus hexagrammi]|uniref:Uncharacterized protein n=1 Tax=Paenibacillus hexagrammi TaxID=2908839 RepID=A0ABY3SMI0_9BACL|nr:hypothetical protein [Paenibacillus sp. YPD9-1]UJF35204.1 hypothetical protein L0M14_08800 [Paenibacillus sp. YPD9-1]